MSETNSQRADFLSGNEAAALITRDINYHIMGYYPITPSTELPETLAMMQANGEHEISMIPEIGRAHV